VRFTFCRAIFALHGSFSREFASSGESNRPQHVTQSFRQKGFRTCGRIETLLLCKLNRKSMAMKIYDCEFYELQSSPRSEKQRGNGTSGFVVKHDKLHARFCRSCSYRKNNPHRLGAHTKRQIFSITQVKVHCLTLFRVRLYGRSFPASEISESDLKLMN
jgi:hypothetical protein